jgi:hypothetical protein
MAWSEGQIAGAVGFATGAVVVGGCIALLLPRAIQADAAAIGEVAGRNYIGRVYGLTPERIAGIQRLAALIPSF